MKIVAWNLNHRTREVPISSDCVRAIAALRTDVLVLTEYVHGPSRPDFFVQLGRIGFAHISVSKKHHGQNQVLVATRSRHTIGGIDPPVVDECSEGNFLHVALPAVGFELVGLRAPAYRSSADLKRYWAALESVIDASARRRIVYVGDFNTDPFARRDAGARTIRALLESGWGLPRPRGEWSYVSSSGRTTSRIDYALLSPGLKATLARYCTQIYGVRLAGPSGLGAVSDHAALVVKVDRREAAQKTKRRPLGSCETH